MKTTSSKRTKRTSGAFGKRRAIMKAKSGWFPGKNQGCNHTLSAKDKAMQKSGFRKKVT